jgi:hypothetical protein
MKRGCWHREAILLASSLLVAAAAANARPAEPFRATAEYSLKAAVLVNLAKFTDWPTNAFAGPAAPLVIGVVGEDPFGPALEEAARAQTVAGHPVQVRRLSATAPLPQVHVLFISRSEQNRLPQVLEAVRGAPVLTVSDVTRFARQGGMVNLVLRDEMVRFEVNLNSVEAAGLRLSSKVLKYATLVAPTLGGPNTP